jgi:hypothetical protein
MDAAFALHPRKGAAATDLPMIGEVFAMTAPRAARLAVRSMSPDYQSQDAEFTASFKETHKVIEGLSAGIEYDGDLGAALAGSVIGGLTSFATAWITQRQQANVQWLLEDKRKRQELYNHFIEEASKLYADALLNNQINFSALVALYALVSKMRVLSGQEIVEAAETVLRMIVDRYFLPNKTISDLRPMLDSGALDPLQNFSEACRRELDPLH